MRAALASVDIRVFISQVWDKELAETAQQYSEQCHFSPNPSVTTTGGIRRGENQGYTRSTSLLDGAVQTMREWVQNTGDPRYTQVSHMYSNSV